MCADEPVTVVDAIGITASPEGPPRAEGASGCSSWFDIKAQTAQTAQATQAAQAAQAAQGPRDCDISQRISRPEDTVGLEVAPREAQLRASRPEDTEVLEGAPPRGSQLHTCRPSDTVGPEGPEKPPRTRGAAELTDKPGFKTVGPSGAPKVQSADKSAIEAATAEAAAATAAGAAAAASTAVRAGRADVIRRPAAEINAAGIKAVRLMGAPRAQRADESASGSPLPTLTSGGGLLPRQPGPDGRMELCPGCHLWGLRHCRRVARPPRR